MMSKAMSKALDKLENILCERPIDRGPHLALWCRFNPDLAAAEIERLYIALNYLKHRSISGNDS
jgi:hypothetical protein